MLPLPIHTACPERGLASNILLLPPLEMLLSPYSVYLTPSEGICTLLRSKYTYCGDNDISTLSKRPCSRGLLQDVLQQQEDITSSVSSHDGCCLHGLRATLGYYVLLSTHSHYQPHDSDTSNRYRHPLLAAEVRVVLTLVMQHLSVCMSTASRYPATSSTVYA